MKCVQYLFLGSLLGMGRSADGHVFSLFLVKVSLLHSRFQCCHATQRNATQRNAAQRNAMQRNAGEERCVTTLKTAAV